MTSRIGRDDSALNCAIADAAPGSSYAVSPITSGCDRPFAVSIASMARSTASIPSWSYGGWTSNQLGSGRPLARSASTRFCIRAAVSYGPSAPTLENDASSLPNAST